MSKIQMIQAFAQRAADALSPGPHASGARASSSHRMGVFAALGAVIVGAGMLAANVERHRHMAALAAAEPLPAAAALTAPVIAEPPPAPQPSAIALAPPPPPPVAEATPKATTRVDMTPTGAIAKDAKPHKHPHHKKAKDVDPAQ